MQHPAPRNNPPELRIKLLAQLYESGLHRQMIDAAQQLLESFPKSALLHNMLGTAYLDLRQYDLDRAGYEAAIALAPDCAEALNNLGNALENQGNLQAAVTSYTQALVCEPKNEQNQNNLTRARQQLGATCSSKNPTDKQ